MIQRESFDWGTQLTTHPFEGDSLLGALLIRAEIGLPRETKRPTVKVTFSGAVTSTPLSLIEAQTWASALSAMVLEAQRVITEMKPAPKPRRKK